MPQLVFICSGNTCRSPMAECLARALLARRGSQEGWKVLSAGIYAESGAPASEGAKRAMALRGLTLEKHRSHAVTRMLLNDAALVVGMCPDHIARLRELYPNCKTPMLAFDDPPIADPYGGDGAAYERAARDLERQLPALIDALLHTHKKV